MKSSTTSFIVITSIFEPTEPVLKFSELTDYKLIVVGDKKTPCNWKNKNTTFLSVSEQERMNSKLSKKMPYNHYCRKMLGYLEAIKSGATVIVDTDDDNIPKNNWEFPPFVGKFETIPSNLGFVNIYNYYTDNKIWPRGLPLNLINKYNIIDPLEQHDVRVGVWQGLADLDPDVDAIYRLTSNASCTFKERAPIVLNKGTVTPFNSQNTMICKDLFPLLYLPTYVTFRFTDILRGIVAQPIMWKHEYCLGFTNATVIQKRNLHDYFKDFLSEIPMYVHIEKVYEVVEKVVNGKLSVADNLYNSYEALLKEEIVNKQEMECLESWLFDLRNY